MHKPEDSTKTNMPAVVTNMQDCNADINCKYYATKNTDHSVTVNNKNVI